MKKAANYLSSCGETNEDGKPVSWIDLRNWLRVWYTDNPDRAWKMFFPYLPLRKWRRVVMNQAGARWRQRRQSYIRWLIQNPWTLEDEYRPFLKFYISPEEQNVIRELSASEGDIQWKMCQMRAFWERSARNRAALSNKRLEQDR